MKRRGIAFRKVVLPTITALVLAMAATGCVPGEKEIISYLQDGKQIEVMVQVDAEEEATVKEGERIETQWVELGDKTTYPELREAVDEIFEIDLVKAQDGSTDKAGVLYVMPGATDVSTNNSTLLNAFQNETFRNEYWNDEVAKKLVDSASLAYTDIDEDTALAASINAYYDLIRDTEPNYFNGNESVNRIDFMAMITRAETHVQTIRADESIKTACNDDSYNIFVKYLDEHAFLKNRGDFSFNPMTSGGNITTAEAVYLIVNYYFPEELASVNLETDTVTYKDMVNSGDIALDKGFYTKDKDGDIHTQLYSTSYLLRYMLENNVVDERIYKAFVVASNLELLPEAEVSSWNSTMTKKESIELLLRAYEIYGEANNVSSGNGKKDSNIIISKDKDVDANSTANVDSNDAIIETVEDAEYQTLVENLIHEEAVANEAVPEVADELISRISALDKTMYATQVVNTREGDSAEYERVSSLYKGQAVHVTGQSTESKWYQITNEDGSVVYVSNNFLVDNKPANQSKPANTAVAPAPAPTPSPVPEAAAPPIVDYSGEFEYSGEIPAGTVGGLGSGGSGYGAGVQLY